MTEQEATQLLRATEALIRSGRGVCSQKTFDAIASVLTPRQAITADASPFGANPPIFAGIELSVDPFMEDGKIWPVIVQHSMLKVRS